MLFQISEDKKSRQCLETMVLYLHLKSKSLCEIEHKLATQKTFISPCLTSPLLSFHSEIAETRRNVYSFSQKVLWFLYFCLMGNRFSFQNPTQEYILSYPNPSFFIIFLHSTYNYLTYYMYHFLFAFIYLFIWLLSFDNQHL